IFGSDPVSAAQIRKVMNATFPERLLTVVLEQIVVNAPPDTREIFARVGDLVTRRRFEGRVGIWGGPDDRAVSASEGLTLVNPSDVPRFPNYFLPAQPPGTTGLARRLNPQSNYISARWNFSDTSREYLRNHLVKVTNPKNGKSAEALPV